MRHSEEDCQVISHCLARGYYLDALNYSSATGALAAILHLLWAAAWATRNGRGVRELGPVIMYAYTTRHWCWLGLLWFSFSRRKLVMYVHRARHIQLIKVYENSKRIISKTMWVPIKLFFLRNAFHYLFISLLLYVVPAKTHPSSGIPFHW
jgi:hypothetical protein